MDQPDSRRPYWLPDTPGFLAIAIIALIALIVLILLSRPISLDDKTAGVLTVVIGVLVSSLKDVYSYYFGSSTGSRKKDDTINKIAAVPPAAPPAAGA